MKDKIKRFISVCLNESLFHILRIKARKSYKGNSNHIFVLRFAHIGDFCIWLDSARAFRNLYPDKKIIFLTYSYKNVQELAEATGYFDKVISLDTEGFHRIKALREAAGFCGDTIINANPSRSLLSDLFVLAVNVRHRIAQQSDHAELSATKMKRSDKIYEKVIPCNLKAMELIKNAEFMRGLGLKDFKADLSVLPDVPCDVDTPTQKYAVIFPDADAPIQMWNYKNYVKVVQNLISEYGVQCLILGGNRYRDTGAAIEKEVNSSLCKNRMGETNLVQCIQLVRNASIVISNDTGGAHIAAATRTPCVVLAAGWNRGRFFPYQVETEGETLLPVDVVTNLPCLGCGIENINRFDPECGIDGVPRCIAMNTPEVINEKIKELWEKCYGK
ncbi:hypothetical protein DWY84_04810 [Clostridium sp. AF27-2AA]|jgi:ADP-heptose:LPS heptosyltransferase|uniref:glycosyltransferase family 9 protein n=1 Tax=Clostridium sp. AF27-2AA TaxID=2292206 RepID=UPI000E513989|nr:glycosyltransferase family 9 protein [Clostridium sp. AF27-2AA]RHQ33825.1 hypothetical protein DWY84_04810 [Clostridium sp. AF27-2AA]